jgi:Histidine phosphatase superfamily (branch 1)
MIRTEDKSLAGKETYRVIGQPKLEETLKDATKHAVKQFEKELANMSETLPVIYLARHGETAWNLTGQHMGRIDMPLTERGERNARRLGERLRGLTFAKVFTSPLQRASRTYEGTILAI